MEWIRKARQKIKNMCNIPLLEEARKILDRNKKTSLLSGTQHASPRVQQSKDEYVI